MTENLMEPDLAPKPQRLNPQWVGLIMALLLPGSAHFLSGQRRVGAILYLICFLLVVLPYFPLSIAGVIFFYLAAGLLAVYILFHLTIVVLSWRSTQRLGCFGWILFIGTVLILPNGIVSSIAPLAKTYIVELYQLNGMSMAPTLISPSDFAPEIQRPDRIVANKWYYRVGDPQRGDIVTFRAWRDPSITNVKRIVGLPGETVDIESPYILINGERLTEPAIFAKMAARQDGYIGYCTLEELGYTELGITLPVTLGSDEFFILGDNSQWSEDSRFMGPVLRQDITGKVIRIFYPFDRIREFE